MKTYNAGKDIRKNNSFSRPAHVKSYVLRAQGLIALLLIRGGLRPGRLEVQSLSGVYSETLFQTNKQTETVKLKCLASTIIKLKLSIQ